MPFEELKQKHAAMWGAGPFQHIAETIADMHDARDRDARIRGRASVARPRVRDRRRRRARRASGADVIGIDLAPALIETAKDGRREQGLDIATASATARACDARRRELRRRRVDLRGHLRARPRGDGARARPRRRPGGRLGLANWTPERRPGAMFAMHAAVPAAAPGGRRQPARSGETEEHVEELARRCLRARVRAARLARFEPESGEAAWETSSSTSGRRRRCRVARRRPARGAPPGAWVDSFEHELSARRRIAHAATYLLMRGSGAERDVSLRDEVTDLLQRLIRVDTVNPPGNETACGRAPARLPRGARRRLRALRARCRSGRTSSRGSRAGDGPSLAAPLAHRHRARRSRRVAGRPVVGRAARRGGLGSRRARHEGPGRGERRRDRVARAGGLRARRATWSSPPPPTRRSATTSASRGSARSIPRRSAPTTRSTRAAATGSSSAAARSTSASTAEKMSSPFVLRVRGRSGHASMPAIADNALVKAAPLSSGSAARAGAASRAGDRGVPRGRCSASVPARRGGARAGAGDRPARRRARRAAARHDVSPTMISASQKRNVIPALCEVVCRLPAAARADPGRGGGGGPRGCSARATTSSSGSRASAARARRSRRRSGRRSSPSSPRRSRRAASCRSARRLHRQPLAARGVRHRRLRLLPDAVDGPELAARLDPLGRRARSPVDDLELGVGFCATRPVHWRRELRSSRRSREGGREDPPRRDGARERRARPRPDVLGVRGPLAGRPARGRLRS